MAADTTTGPAGLTLTVNNGVGSAYQAVGRITMCSGIGGKSFAQLKATWLSSSATDRKPGLPTFAPMTADFKYTRATMVQLNALAGIDGYTWKVTNAGGDVWTIDAWITDVPGMDNPEAEASDPETIKGVKFFVRSWTYAQGGATEGG